MRNAWAREILAGVSTRRKETILYTPAQMGGNLICYIKRRPQIEGVREQGVEICSRKRMEIRGDWRMLHNVDFKKDELSSAFSTHGQDERCTGFFMESLKERDYLTNQCEDGNI